MAYIIWHPVLRQYADQRVRYNLVLNNMKNVTGTAILDLGCGSGCLGRILELKGNKVIYGDLNVAYYHRKWRLVWRNVGNSIRLDGSNLPFRDSSFDYIVSVDVLEHMPPQKRYQFIKEITRCCKKEVHLTFSTFSSTSPKVTLFKLMFNLLHVSLENFWSTICEHERFPHPSIKRIKNLFNGFGFITLNSRPYQGSLSLVSLGLREAYILRFPETRFPFMIYFLYLLTTLFYIIIKYFDLAPFTSWYLHLIHNEGKDVESFET